ncbi:hypothetical protein V1281_004481 [Nitrobacteraceae bacterium AZCC 2161]
MMQRVRCLVRKHPKFNKQTSDAIHALPATADDPPLPSRCPARRALRLAGLVDQGRVEAPHSGGDDASISLPDLDDPPPARRNTKIDSKNTPDDRHTHYAPEKDAQPKIDY